MYEAVVIGVSAGGMNALKTILPRLPKSFPLPIAIVQHAAPHPDNYLADYLGRISDVAVKEAEDKEPLLPGTVYLAPPGYHLLIEPGPTFSLSLDDRVNYCCPSIDVLFESAADVFHESLIGVILTGANADGSHGLKTIKEYGGLAIVEDPSTAESPYMPRTAIASGPIDHILRLDQIALVLAELGHLQEGGAHDRCIGA